MESGNMGGQLGLNASFGFIILAMVGVVLAAWIAVRLGFRAPDE